MARRWRSLALFLAPLIAAYADFPLDCAGRDGDSEDCQHSLESVTTVVPGSFYVVKLPCLDCGVRYENGALQQRKNDLLFNISLSHDNRTLLLNQQPILPSLPTAPNPPHIVAPQIDPKFSRADLDKTIQCTREPCANGEKTCWCTQQPVSKSYMAQANIDYDYFAYWVESHPETQTEKWKITLDAIAGYSDGGNDRTWVANNTEQYMLQITLNGKEIEGARYPGEKDLQAGSSPFGIVEASERVYEYEIIDVDLLERTYTFPASGSLGFRGTLRRFFGRDIVSKNGHIVYLQSEWGNYGKLGSLRQYFGIFVHDWRWDVVAMILGGAAASLLSVWFACKLFWVVKEQRELARWDGMDTVWENIRRDGDRAVDEEDGLLEGGYRDEPDDEDCPPRYTDEVQTNKPLPSKPLPDKPLPAVPLIDA